MRQHQERSGVVAVADSDGELAPNSAEFSLTERTPTDPAPVGGANPAATSVLLVATDDALTRALLSTLRRAQLQVVWSPTAAELFRRAEQQQLGSPAMVFLDADLPDAMPEQVIALLRRRFPAAIIVALGQDLDDERRACLLGLGVPSLGRAVNPTALAGLTLQLTAQQEPRSGPTLSASGHCAAFGLGPLEAAVEDYAARRAFSRRQEQILRLHLGGKHDKEIASCLACAESTVYEHWRRMAKKAHGAQKGDVIADFHRFLAARTLAD